MTLNKAPTTRTESLILKRVTHLWTSTNVEVFFVWDGGNKRYYFRWDTARSAYVRVARFAKTESRVVALMNHGVLFDRVVSLSCPDCKAKGISCCKHD